MSSFYEDLPILKQYAFPPLAFFGLLQKIHYLYEHVSIQMYYMY